MRETLLPVVLPSMGESVTEGTVTGIRKSAGDMVEAGETLIDVTTDKVDVEIPSPAAGRIARVAVKDGDTVAVGALLAEIEPVGSTKGSASSTASTSTVVEMPAVGESISQGTVRAWLKREGDVVERDDVIVEIAVGAEKVEIPSPVAGHLLRIFAKEGQSITIGAPLCEIGDAAAASAQVSETPPAAKSAASGTAPPAIAPAADGQHLASAIHAPPGVRRFARENGVDLSKISGSGPAGVIRRSDIEAAASPAARGDGRSQIVEPGATTTALKGPAAALAAAMEQSLSIPTATSFRTIGVSMLDERRSALNDALKNAGRKEKLSFTHLIAFALVRAAKANPSMVTSFRRGATGPERVNRGVHLGLAVDTQRKDGSRFLVVPVIRNAGELDFKAFLAGYETLVAKARENKLVPDDFSGASITLTNPGGIGTVASVPRLMDGQGTIVASGAIGYPPGFTAVPADRLSGLGVTKVMTLTSTYDHRVIQGAESGEFLRGIDQLLSGANGFYDAIAQSLGVALAPSAGPTIAPVASTITASAPRPAGTIPESQAMTLATAAAAGMSLISRIRTHGHTAATLDPLGGAQDGDPVLESSSLNLDEATARLVPAATARTYAPGDNLSEVLANLRKIYCSTIAYEVEHITSHEQRSWLRREIESGAHVKTLTRERKIELLDRLTRVEAFERYLRKAFLGQKTFSIEGIDAMVPMLEELLHLLADDGVRKIEIGTAHRGRLSLITHVVDRPYEEVLVEFEHAELRGGESQGDVTGDVKYHQGAQGTYATSDGKSIDVVLVNNPSHLEAVDGVVVGRARADQTDRATNIATLDPSRAVPLLVHGDAAFTGQGVVAEVLNMQALRGYSVGGTVHLIANNQIGFTTEPSDERSTRYASDLAKGTDIPVIHVNADDIEACIGAVALAVGFRRKFKRDVLIDLIGYRRFGHNEADEPAYTQPLMYATIAAHATVRELFAQRLIADGVITKADAQQRYDAAYKRVAEAHANVQQRIKEHGTADAAKRPQNGAPTSAPSTRVAADVLKALNQQLLAVPPDFTVHPKLAKQLDRRRGALEPGGEIDWATGEALAIATLIGQGVPVRLTGQDTERGTFSHRHSVLHDAKTGAAYVPMQHLSGARASFEVYNSPLSEYACLAFEYGYSTAAPNALVLWEAQFGDFANGAQIIIDQFISAGMAKWGQTSRLTLLLPHGYEGAGPEHSSARLERFLQLASDGNIRIANCTTPAQYFHLLRDQALASKARPLVVMTPKSLLRMKVATSRLEDLTEGGLQPIVDDPNVKVRKGIRRLILCSGKIYYDLIASTKRAEAKDLSIVRVEMLEPFPLDAVLGLVRSYPDVKQVTWVQEEPRNMGARAFVSRRIREKLQPLNIAFDYEGRPDRASPSEGYPGAHAVEQERIVTAALAPRRG
ncbi:MAG TPA: multifunctional oxoglutarate decarboxylase/oxoglutarate dehydrogenase thiamine pyrophosphate-binding subunit/dihydrolipoyllysine-residue succinyltransferase subunit [Candidatus Eremiobacteraceae bacterium]